MKPSLELKVLREARALIAKPENWTQGALARNKTNERCDPHDKDACQWCASGAIHRVAARRISLGAQIVKLVEDAISGLHVASWNDVITREHAEVIDAFDKAITTAEAA